MSKIITALLVVVAAIVTYLGINWLWPTYIDNQGQPRDQSQAAEPVYNPTDTAEPGLGGFYQLNWSCQATHQYLSFSILTAGVGYLELTIETIDPTTRPHSVVKVLTERMPVNDGNRDQLEARVFTSTVPAGHGVHIGLTGANGARTSEDRTLTPLSC